MDFSSDAAGGGGGNTAADTGGQPTEIWKVPPINL